MREIKNGYGKVFYLFINFFFIFVNPGHSTESFISKVIITSETAAGSMGTRLYNILIHLFLVIFLVIYNMGGGGGGWGELFSGTARRQPNFFQY